MEDDAKKSDVGGSLANMGISDFVGNVAIGIAQGQFALDQACMEMASFMGEAEISFGKMADSDEPDKMSLLELGFSPNFYQFTETSIELRVAISSQLQKNSEMVTKDQKEKGYDISGSDQSSTNYNNSQYAFNNSRKSSTTFKDMSVTSVDAKYASTYNYKAEASSVIKTKITAVPPPAVLEEILQGKLQERRQNQERLRWKMQVKNILATVLERSNTLLTNNAALAYSGASPTQAKKETLSETISSGMQKLQTDYTTLSLDHWAVINNLLEREKADNSLESSFNTLQLLIDEMVLDNPPKIFTERLSEIKTSVEEFKTIIEVIYTRLYSADA